MPNGEIDFSEADNNRFLKDIRNGVITLFNLPTGLYNKIGKEITEAVFKGIDFPDGADITAPNYELERQLKRNAYRFSSAKVFQHVNDVSNVLVDENGIRRSYSQFKKIADTITDDYVEDWLKTEYNTAQAMAERAGEWRTFQQEKKIFPLLRYQTVLDAAVRDEHAALEGIVRPVDDAFWNSHNPLNGWNCRCQAVQIESGKLTDLKKNPPAEIDPLFKGNVGKSGEMFSSKHPYFSVPIKFKKRKDNNFGLPLPKDVRGIKPSKTILIPKIKTASTIKEAQRNQKDWLKTLSKKEKDALENWSSTDYRHINAKLRYGDKLDVSKSRAIEITENIPMMQDILKDSPKYTGEVYRGLRFRHKEQLTDFISKAKKGNIFTDKGFMSTSYEKIGMREFQGNDFNVSMRIKSKNGTMIDDIARRKSEKEVLFMNNSSFKITSTKFNEARNLYEVEMKEL